MGRGNVSKINRKEERKQQAASRKAKQKAIISKMENLVGTKSISELQDMSWGEKVRFVMMSSWILATSTMKPRTTCDFLLKL